MRGVRGSEGSACCGEPVASAGACWCDNDAHGWTCAILVRQGAETWAVHLETGCAGRRTTSRLERFHRELSRRGRMGTGWIKHNLLVLLQMRGLLHSTT